MQAVMDLAVIQIQALVRQAQDEYVIAFAMSIGRALAGPLRPAEVMETCKYLCILGHRGSCYFSGISVESTGLAIVHSIPTREQASTLIPNPSEHRMFFLRLLET